MKISTIIKYFHPGLQIGLEDVRSAWLFPISKPPVKLNTIIYQGGLYYRLPITGKRISYKHIKKGLIKKEIVIMENLLPF